MPVRWIWAPGASRSIVSPPGPILTDLPAKVLSEEEIASFADRTALGRWGTPRELIGPALLLASDAGSYITGETLVVDGGTICRSF